MPEGPEISISRDQIRKILINRHVDSVHAVGGRYAVNPPVGMNDFIRALRPTAS